MTVSPVRGLIFFMLGLPIGFILSALGFAVVGRDIAAPALAPFALIAAAVIGIGAAIRPRKKGDGGN